MALGIVDLDLIRIRVVGHRHDERAPMAAARVNSGAACRECEAGDNRTQHVSSGHDVLLERQKYPRATEIFRAARRGASLSRRANRVRVSQRDERCLQQSRQTHVLGNAVGIARDSSSGIVIDASSITRPDIVVSVSRSDACACVARAEALISAMGLSISSPLLDDPVQRVLQHAGHSVSVFGTGNQDGVAGLKGRSKPDDCGRRCIGVQIRVERWNVRELTVD